MYTYIKICDIPHLTLSRIYIFTVLGFFHTRQTCWQMWKDTKPQEICFLGPCHHRLTAWNESACLSLFVVGWRICLFCSHGFVTAYTYLWSPRQEILQPTRRCLCEDKLDSSFFNGTYKMSRVLKLESRSLLKTGVGPFIQRHTLESVALSGGLWPSVQAFALETGTVTSDNRDNIGLPWSIGSKWNMIYFQSK